MAHGQHLTALLSRFALYGWQAALSGLVPSSRSAEFPAMVEALRQLKSWPTKLTAEPPTSMTAEPREWSWRKIVRIRY